MLQTTITFRPEDEGATGDGWSVSVGQIGETPVVTAYATLTAAFAAIQAEFQADADTDGYFTEAAEDQVLVTEAAAVTAAKAALLAAEGL